MRKQRHSKSQRDETLPLEVSNSCFQWRSKAFCDSVIDFEIDDFVSRIEHIEKVSLNLFGYAFGKAIRLAFMCCLLIDLDFPKVHFSKMLQSFVENTVFPRREQCSALPGMTFAAALPRKSCEVIFEHLFRTCLHRFTFVLSWLAKQPNQCPSFVAKGVSKKPDYEVVVWREVLGDQNALYTISRGLDPKASKKSSMRLSGPNWLTTNQFWKRVRRNEAKGMECILCKLRESHDNAIDAEIFKPFRVVTFLKWTGSEKALGVVAFVSISVYRFF